MPESIPCAVLMCHAPIVLPELAGPEAGRVAATARAMADAAATVVGNAPDAVVVLTPHAPRSMESWRIGGGEALKGSFDAYGLPELAFSLPGATLAAAALQSQKRYLGLRISPMDPDALDHGALVPLHFLVRAGWQGPTLLISPPALPQSRECRRMGAALARAAASLGQRWAVVASGGMSHRLVPTSPAGYAPAAKDFDLAVVRALAAGDLRAAVGVPPHLRDLAAEDVLDVLEVAAAAVGWEGGAGLRLLSYEAPFGVGYLVAILHDARAAGRRAHRSSPAAASGGAEPVSSGAVTATPSLDSTPRHGT